MNSGNFGLITAGILGIIVFWYAYWYIKKYFDRKRYMRLVTGTKYSCGHVTRRDTTGDDSDDENHEQTEYLNSLKLELLPDCRRYVLEDKIRTLNDNTSEFLKSLDTKILSDDNIDLFKLSNGLMTTNKFMDKLYTNIRRQLDTPLPGAVPNIKTYDFMNKGLEIIDSIKRVIKYNTMLHNDEVTKISKLRVNVTNIFNSQIF